jgi:hypothetical protein
MWGPEQLHQKQVRCVPVFLTCNHPCHLQLLFDEFCSKTENRPGWKDLKVWQVNEKLDELVVAAGIVGGQTGAGMRVGRSCVGCVGFWMCPSFIAGIHQRLYGR